MEMKILIPALLVALFSQLTHAAESIPPTPCNGAREWITALEYFRKSKNLGLDEPTAQKLALQVAAGCEGSAGRVIQVFKILSAAEIDSKNSLTVALEFAKRTDQETGYFKTYFKSLFASDSFDLDARASLAMARSLTVEINSNPDWVKRDFERLGRYCLKESELNWSKPACGEFAVRVARLSAKSGHPVSDDFIELQHFLSSDVAGSLPKSRAVQLAEETIALAPKAGPSFIQSFRYAVAKNGLNLSIQSAVPVASKMAALTKTPDSPALETGTPR